MLGTPEAAGLRVAGFVHQVRIVGAGVWEVAHLNCTALHLYKLLERPNHMEMCHAETSPMNSSTCT